MQMVPVPPEMPPEAMQQRQAQIQQAQKQLQAPDWGMVLQRIKDDQNRAFTINVQTSSTIDLDTASDKAEVGEFMNQMGQLMAGLQPLAAFGPSGVAVIKATLEAVCNRFKFGGAIAEQVKALQLPQPPQAQPDPAAQATAQAKIQELQISVQVSQAEAQARLAEIQRKEQLAAAEQEYALEKLKAERELLAIKVAAARLKAQAASATIPAKPSAQNAPVRS